MAGLLAFIALGIYVNYVDVCDPYQTTFLGETIRFPMMLEEANQHYHLQSDGTVSWSASERDTLLVVSTRLGSTKELDRVVFYLRDLSLDDMSELRALLEKQYKQKFTFNPVIASGLSYMKLADCVFLQLSTFGFPENQLIGTGTKQVTCMVSFTYRVSESDVNGTLSEGGWSYGLPPDRRPHPAHTPDKKQEAAPSSQP